MSSVRKGILRYGTTLSLATFSVFGIIVACGSTPPEGAGGNGQGPGTTSTVCLTPQQGCPCTPGAQVACGKVATGDNHFVYCIHGTRTCGANGTFGDCLGAPAVGTAPVSSVPEGGGLGTSALPVSIGLTPMALGANESCQANIVDSDAGPGGTVIYPPSALPACSATAPGGGVDCDCTAAGATCGVKLDMNINAQAIARAGKSADFSCDHNSGICSFKCESGADCTSHVDHTGIFNQTCESGSTCDITVDHTTTCNITCPTGATCNISVDHTLLCNLNCGQGSCNIIQCDHATCPSVTTTEEAVDPCDPYCNSRTDTPVGLTLPAPLTVADGGLTVGAGPAACVATLKGTVYDPRGNNPLPHVMVYVPSAALTNVTTGPACDTCASLVSGSPSALALSGADGTFTLTNVAGNTALTVVLQTGRWRRVVTVPAIPCGTTATLATADSHLPTKQQGQDNVPKIAITMSSGDPLQCLLRKVGIDDDQFSAGPSTATGRVHLYSHNGQTFTGTTNEGTLWGNLTNMQGYDFVLAPCDLNHGEPNTSIAATTTILPTATASASQSANVMSYVNAGGRLFATHWMSHDFVYNNWAPPGGPVVEEFGKSVDDDREPNSFPYTIDTSTPDGLLLSQWASTPAVAAATVGPPSLITFDSWRDLSKTVNTAAGAIRLSYGDSSLAPVGHTMNQPNQYAASHVNMYSFTTPWPTTPATACGKVVVSQSHVSTVTTATSAFPTGCTGGLTMNAQEKAFEFLLFDATACSGVVPIITPPLPPSNVTYSVDYTATCPAGTQVYWQLFQWQGNFDGGSSIDFRAATAASTALLPTSSSDPSTVKVGTADNANAQTDGTWWYETDGTNPLPVSQDLANATPKQTSQNSLRIFMTFKTTPPPPPSPPLPDGGPGPPPPPGSPTGQAAVLATWRQLYDCIPSE